jgi:hypothetical protein
MYTIYSLGQASDQVCLKRAPFVAERAETPFRQCTDPDRTPTPIGRRDNALELAVPPRTLRPVSGNQISYQYQLLR